MAEKRFRVALSFAGEKRDYVKQVADLLAKIFDEESILYDHFHEAKFANADLAFILPDLYHNHSDLIIVVLCTNYDDKAWCGLEWRAIFSLIKDKNVTPVMLTRFDYAEFRGDYGLSGYIDLDHKLPQDTVQLILQRLALNEGKDRDYYLHLLDKLNTTTTNATTSEPESFFNVPFNTKGDEFVGREGKGQEIFDALNQSGCAAIGQAVHLHGLGGFGKTQMAVEFAHSFRDQYPNGVYWLVADESIDAQLLQIADKQKWVVLEDKSIDQTAEAKRRFSKLKECLIIFDNVDDHEAIEGYLPDINNKVHLLITSREPQDKYKTIEIGLLDIKDAEKLLLSVADRNQITDAERNSLENILETLGGVPLALEMVGGYLKQHSNVTFTAYQKYLDEIPLDTLEAEFPKNSFTKHDHSIIRTLRISEDTINKKPLMAEILKILAFSGSSSMGVSLLTALTAVVDDFAFNTALGEATNLRLIKKDVDAERYSIHRLVAKVIRHENPVEDNHVWVDLIARNLNNWFDKRKEDFYELNAFEAELDHLNEWQKTTIDILPNRSIYLGLLKTHPYQQRGNAKQALSIAISSLDLYKLKALDDKKLVGHLLNDIGVLNSDLGNHSKALGYKLKALDLHVGHLGEKHPATASSFNNVGSSYSKLGNHPKAFEYLQKALDLNVELLGEKHPETAKSYNNVGICYRDLGRNTEALEYHQKALVLSLELLGERHPDTASSYDNVGGSYSHLGRPAEALEYRQKALDLFVEMLGEKHPDTAASYNNVGDSYSKLGKHEQALEYRQKALDLFVELLGEKHPDTIQVCLNLITSLIALGNKEKAGRLAASFLPHIPQAHPSRKFFEMFSSNLQGRRKKKRHKKK